MILPLSLKAWQVYRSFEVHGSDGTICIPDFRYYALQKIEYPLECINILDRYENDLKGHLNFRRFDSEKMILFEETKMHSLLSRAMQFLMAFRPCECYRLTFNKRGRYFTAFEQYLGSCFRDPTFGQLKEKPYCEVLATYSLPIQLLSIAILLAGVIGAIWWGKRLVTKAVKTSSNYDYSLRGLPGPFGLADSHSASAFGSLAGFISSRCD